MTSFVRTASFALLIATAAACGGAQPEPQSQASAETAPASQPLPEKWSDELSDAQKAEFMKAKVAPHMAGVFQAADATKYADFGCKTCHGPNYQSPQEYLPKLVFKNGNLTCFTEQPEVSKFMAEKVAPEMAAALGVAPFDPATHQGFGCTGCHAIVPGN